MNAQEWITHLHLAPHPEGGWFRETYRSGESIAGAGLPARYTGSRSFGTAIVFLLEKGTFSALHRLKSDEIWHFYGGDPVEVVSISSAGAVRRATLAAPGSPDGDFQAVISTGDWFGARSDGSHGYGLVGCTVAPGFDFADFELGDRGALTAAYPHLRDLIVSLTRDRADRFEAAYRSASPPWDIGRPQSAVAEIVKEGGLAGRVLDVGAGLGWNARLLAANGRRVIGIDPSAEAVRRASERAGGPDASFHTSDILRYDGPPGPYDSALDSGVFHIFQDDERPVYAASIRSLLRPGGRLYLICFSEHQAGPGPRRVTEREIRDVFQDGFELERVRETRYETLIHAGGARAWLAVLRRL